jgi:hypothetical protein
VAVEAVAGVQQALGFHQHNSQFRELQQQVRQSLAEQLMSPAKSEQEQLRPMQMALTRFRSAEVSNRAFFVLLIL